MSFMDEMHLEQVVANGETSPDSSLEIRIVAAAVVFLVFEQSAWADV